VYAKNSTTGRWPQMDADDSAENCELIRNHGWHGFFYAERQTSNTVLVVLLKEKMKIS
jgi:hypothetical protein